MDISELIVNIFGIYKFKLITCRVKPNSIHRYKRVIVDIRYVLIV